MSSGLTMVDCNMQPNKQGARTITVARLVALAPKKKKTKVRQSSALQHPPPALNSLNLAAILMGAS